MKPIIQVKILNAYDRMYADTGEPPKHVYLGYEEFAQLWEELGDRRLGQLYPVGESISGPFQFGGLLVHRVHERNHFNVA